LVFKLKERGRRPKLIKLDIRGYLNKYQWYSQIRESFKNLYSSKLENIEEMDKFLNAYDLSKLDQESINHLKRSITSIDTEELTKSLPIKRKKERKK
jgi:hypothetical protein